MELKHARWPEDSQRFLPNTTTPCTPAPYSPEHVHLVIGRHMRSVERIVAHLKRGATLKLFEEDRHPLMGYRGPRGAVPSPWSKRTGWTVYLNDEQAVRHRIKYVQENPLKEGKPRQRWSFVKPFRV